MSSSIDNVDCPKCGGSALAEQDTNTLKIHIACTNETCRYDSDDDIGLDDDLDDDFEIDLDLEFDPYFDFDDDEDDDDLNYYDDRTFNG